MAIVNHNRGYNCSQKQSSNNNSCFEDPEMDLNLEQLKTPLTIQNIAVNKALSDSETVNVMCFCNYLSFFVILILLVSD